MLKKISTEARRDIERFMGTKVYLETWVKVKENWRDNMNYISKLRLRRTVSCAEEGKRRFSCEREQAAACAASFGASAENAIGRIHFARQWINGFLARGRLRGTNWRDNMNYIRSFGYDEQ